MFHTLYKITNKLNGKFYVGIHSTENLNDDYMGSGVGIIRAINKYGTENFEKEILFIFKNRKDMLEAEIILVDNIFVRQPDTYNANTGGIGGSAKGRKLSKKTRKKMSASKLKENWQKGKPGSNRGKFGAKHYKSKAVRQIDPKTNETIAVYGSIREAERMTMADNRNISRSCKETHRIVNGYKWRYARE